jgi:hypothetical protein
LIKQHAKQKTAGNIGGYFFNTMQIFSPKKYTNSPSQHFETYFGKPGKRRTLDKDPFEKLHPDFYISEFSTYEKREMFCYCTDGISIDKLDDNPIELVLYSPKSTLTIVELLTTFVSYHRNVLPLNIHHTVTIGQPWIHNSKYDYGFISLPYLDGEYLEIFRFGDSVIHFYRFIPITEKDQKYKIENGCESLVKLFEEKQINYLDPKRNSLIT